MQVDDPLDLPVGTAVSAKYKGAFCEAKVRNVNRVVKCKVTFKMGLGTTTVSDQYIKGLIRIGQIVQAKHPDKKEYLDGTVTKIMDCSLYTVVFDDGDITTLRRSALCLKSGRHFNESETLDQLPLTHPEHFGNPVIGGGNHRRGRRGNGNTMMASTSTNKQISNDSSDEGDENEGENEPDFEGYTIDIGRVVNVESTEKKRGKENWFPGLIVIPTAQPTSKINFKEEYLIRSFKDDRYYTVPKKEISDFNKNIIEKIDNNNSSLLDAVNKAIKYLDTNELPEHWEKRLLFNIHAINIESDDNFSESSDDEPCEEKDRFVAQLYKFMDDSGTPLNKSPMICNRDVDLHRLFRVVHKFGGYNRVTNQNKWRSITNRLKLATTTTTAATTSSQNIYNQVKQVYKKCLLSYESFYRTLGVTMLNHTRSTKKNRGRSLIRDKDRSTPVMSNSPKLEINVKDEEDVDNKKETIEKLIDNDKLKKKSENLEKKRKEVNDNNNSDTNSNVSEEQIEPKTTRRTDKVKEIKKAKISESPQQTRSKIKNKEMKKLPEPTKLPKKIDDEQNKKRGRKKTVINVEDNDNSESVPVNVGDKLKVYYGGPNQDFKITYEAKVIEIDKDSTGPIYLVHYTGWNTRYDEWITLNRIAENLSATTKAKRLNKQQQEQQGKTKSSSNNNSNKRGRGTSGRSEQPTRSTTPSSVTSTSSRTKSPAITTRTTRSSKLEFNRKLRRHSAQTDFSNHSDSDDSDDDFSDDNDIIRTRSSSKNDEPTTPTAVAAAAAAAAAIRTYKKRILKNKEEDKRSNRNKRKKSPEKLNSDNDDGNSDQLPKGRDFDLNQIRSELKGFSKTIKLPPNNDNNEDEDDDDDDKDLLSDSTTLKIDIAEQKKIDNVTNDDIYEFKEPEPFEFESRAKLLDDSKPKKRLAQRLFDDLDKASMSTTTTKKMKLSPKDDSLDGKKRFRKLSNKSDDNDNNKDEFDKLVESPSFNNISKLDKSPAQDKKLIKNLLDEPLFKELPETIDDYNKESLSDDNSTTFIKNNDTTIFSDFTKLKTTNEVTKQKELSDDDCDLIRDTIQRVIAHGSSTDDDDFNDNDNSNDNLLITPSTSSYAKKRNNNLITDKKIEPSNIPLTSSITNDKIFNAISPALQETDSTLLESIYLQQPSNLLKTNETTNLIKTSGTKIADSILEKFNSIKNKDDGKDEFVKQDEKKRRNKIISRPYIDNDDDDDHDNSDTDSDSDSEQLIIARSDDDSQTNSAITDKCNDNVDLKESDSNLSMVHVVGGTTDESQNDNDEKRNFKFDSDCNKIDTVEDDHNKKDDVEHDLHSLLLCEETLPPKSPQPDNNDKLIINKAVTQANEMPFASAPSSSTGNNGNKNLLTSNSNDNKLKQPIINNNNNNVVAALILPQIIDNKNLNQVIDNTPPTTPESTISNLSPAHNIDDLSPPFNQDNDSGKSDDVDFTLNTLSTSIITNRKRKSSVNVNKLQPYSEEDTQMISEPSTATTVKKQREDSCTLPAPCKKRRKSNRTNNNDDNLQTIVKRGRKPLNRSRHNSDSDDTSEHSLITATLNLNTYDRTSRPSKYNFFVDLDPSLTSSQRISVLQQRLSDIRKAYADVKTELATVERRRKKIRRRQREELKASKQEMG